MAAPAQPDTEFRQTVEDQVDADRGEQQPQEPAEQFEGRMVCGAQYAFQDQDAGEVEQDHGHVRSGDGGAPRPGRPRMGLDEVIETVVLSSNEDGPRFARKHGFVETERCLLPGEGVPWIALRLS